MVVEMKIEVRKLRSKVVTGGRYTWFPDLKTKENKNEFIEMM